MPRRVFSSLYAASASLELAVIVIALSAVVLAAATFVEGWYGGAAARFGIYDSWWFAALLGVLALNVLAAALIRIPWEKKQTGFVITHAGILVMLAGCLMSRLGGIDAQLPVFEDGTGSVAYEDSQHFKLTVRPRASQVSGDNLAAKVIEIPFASGPFNWKDYRNRLFWFPWKLAHRDRGLIYDRDGVRLEVLDYYSDSRQRPAPPLVLDVGRSAEDGNPAHQTVKLDVRLTQDPNFAQGRVAIGSRQDLAGGEQITFWAAGSSAETAAFSKTAPDGSLGELGQLVLYARGKTFRLPVTELQSEGSAPLGDTGLTVSLERVDRAFRGLILQINGGEEPERMVLLADFPEFNRQGTSHGLFGSYWLDAPKTPEGEAESAAPNSPEAAARKPRIDVLLGTDGKLHYRTWKAPQFGSTGSLSIGRPTTIELPGDGESLVVTVKEFSPQDTAGLVVEPMPFSKPRQGMPAKQAAARLRLTVDGQSEEFWLEGMGSDPFQQPPQGMQKKSVAGEERTVQIELRKDKVDVGFAIFLHNFQRKLDPGTSMASHYSSLVDLRDRDAPEKVIEENVLITLNEPINFTDPATGRSYRLYQESFAGPWKPGDPLYDELASPDHPRDEIFLSWLTVNYDPGRGLKYFGSLLICAGIATMFYMKAYFFKPKRPANRGGVHRSTAPPERETVPPDMEPNRQE